jgi:hypothetical protein
MSAVLTEFTTRGTTDFRKPVLTRVDVSWADASGKWQAVSARMEDRSPGGAGIRITLPVAVGSKVRIQSRQDDFAGEVRYCRADGRDFLLGIQRDTAEGMAFDQPRSQAAPQRSRGSAQPVVQAAAPTPKPQNFPNRQESQLSASSSSPSMMPAQEVNYAIDNQNIPPSRSRNFDPLFVAEMTAELRAEVRAELQAALRAELRAAMQAALRAEVPTELQTKQPATQAGKEEKPMRSKWLELPWRKKPEGSSTNGLDDGEVSRDGNSNSSSEKENSMSDLTQPMPKAPVRSAREVPTFQVDLSPMEEIYRAVGIMNPPRGYSITKVVEMLNSDHIRDLSSEMKRAAVLMALEAAGTTIEQLQKDAKARQDALDLHEAQQRKQVEAEWARKAEEVVQIQAEMESIKAHYSGRISRNLDGVARQKATFAEWVSSKQQECQGMAQAIELCSKSPAFAPTSAPATDVSLVKVSAKTV